MKYFDLSHLIGRLWRHKADRHPIYLVTETLVLWARSEMIGSALNIDHGMMEYWNVGMLDLAE